MPGSQFCLHSLFACVNFSFWVLNLVGSASHHTAASRHVSVFCSTDESDKQAPRNTKSMESDEVFSPPVGVV